MQFKTGDKVKFLNETGGGIVSRVVSGSMVMVATEDGFEMPTATKDIIRINAETKAEKMFDQAFNVDLNSTQEQTDPASEHSRGPASRVSRSAEESPGYYLAFVPDDQQWFITGKLEVRIINHSRADILYNFLLRDENEEYFGFDYGSVEAGSSATIETIERESLSGWTDGIVQIMVHSESEAFLPLQSSFHIKANKFSSEGSYQESGLIRERAIIYRIADLKILHQIAGGKKAPMPEEEAVQVKTTEHKKETLIGKHAVGPHTAVVDLHIGEIVNNIAGMNSHDMFLMQVNYFVRTLESALANNFRKVTYIHGIGNGVLKNSIIEKLKEYEGMENQSASLADYGQGALDVILQYK